MESAITALLERKRAFESNTTARGWEKRQVVPWPEARSLSPSQKALSGIKVLVVDCISQAADRLAEKLWGWGHGCTIANCSLNALRIAAWYHPQVAILNLEMPWMNGNEIAKHLKSDFRKDDCLIIGFTSVAEHKRRQDASETCIDLILARPIKSAVLKT